MIPVREHALEGVRLDEPLDGVSSPSFRYSIATSAALARSPREASRRAPPRRAPTCGSRRLGESSNWPNVSSSFRRTRSSGVCACAAIEGPTKSSASRIARASSGVRRGASAEDVAVELLVDADHVAVELGVDRVAAAAEVDEVEQREVLLELLARDVEARGEVVPRGAPPRDPRRRRRAGTRAAPAAPRSARARRGRPGRSSGRPVRFRRSSPARASAARLVRVADPPQALGTGGA